MGNVCLRVPGDVIKGPENANSTANTGTHRRTGTRTMACSCESVPVPTCQTTTMMATSDNYHTAHSRGDLASTFCGSGFLARWSGFPAVPPVATRFRVRTTRTAMWRNAYPGRPSPTRPFWRPGSVASDPACPVFPRPPLKDFGMSTAGQGLHFRERPRDAVAHILMLHTRRPADVGTGSRTSAISCRLDSSMQFTGKSGSYCRW